MKKMENLPALGPSCRPWTSNKDETSMPLKLDYRLFFRLLFFVAALLPFLLLVERTIDLKLGPNPVEKITHYTGSCTMKFIIITLMISPLQKIAREAFNWSWPDYTRIRRMAGLFAFFYATLHFLIYLLLDRALDFHDIAKDIAKRPYLTIGFAAFLLLLPLAVTSTKKMQKKLGRYWKKLHRSIYLIAIMGVLHYYWLVKADHFWPIAYGLTLLLLFLARLYYRFLKRT